MTRHLRTTLLATVLASALAAFGPAGAAIDLNAPLPLNPQVKVGKLPNGLTYYIQRNGKPEHRLELRLVVKAGSVLEDDDQQGLAHMVEHMAFNGSTRFKRQELISYLQSIGLKFGPDLNAYTSYDETVYILPVPTDRKEDVAKAFTVLEDWAHGVTMASGDIDKERPIMLEDVRQHKGVQDRMQRMLAPKLFNGSRYAVRDTAGKEEVLRQAPPEALRRFYRDWYRPDLMAVIVVGDIDPAEAERLVKAHFSGLVNPANERPRNYPDIPARTSTEALVFSDPEVQVNSLELYYPTRIEPNPTTYGGYRDKTIDILFTLLLNQRLAELAQQANPPYMGAGSANVNLTARHTAFRIGMALGAGGAAPAIAAVQQEQQRIRQFGFTQAELERMRKVVLGMVERLNNERNTTDSAKYVGEYMRNFLVGEPAQGIEAEYRLMQELLPTIALEEINARASKFFPIGSAKLVAYAGSTKSAPPPTAEQLLADVASAEQAKVVNREEKALATSLMARPAKPGAIVAESRDAKLGLTRLTLSNGVKVILKPTDFNKNQVLLGAQRYGGQSLFEEADLANARIASELVSVMGIGNFAPLDVQKVVAGRQAGLAMSLGAYTDEINGGSSAKLDDIETMLQYLWLRFDGVRRDESLYKAYLGNVKEVLRNRAGVPEARLGDAIVDTLYASHPYEPRAFRPEDVPRIDLERSTALYRQRFSSAKGLTFTLAGDFDIATIKPLVTAYLGTLPTPDLPLAYRDVGLRSVRGVVKKVVQAGTEPKSVVSLTFSGPATWSEPETLRMSVLTDVMNLRVNDVLRTKLGLVYSGQVTGSVQRIPNQRYELSVQLPTGPEKVDQLIAALFTEIDSVKTNGPTAAELDKVKANWRQNVRIWQHENGYWLNGLQASLLNGTDPMRLLTITQEIDKLSVADVQQAAQRYFDEKNYVQVVLNPETPVKTASSGQH
ncbi:MAG: M16 family metallopeptidase [Gammaproteobacteria bacterium]